MLLLGFISLTLSVITTQGDYSQRIEALPDSQVQEEVLGVLRAIYPNTTIPEPLAFLFPRWHTDPLFRGSYSNWPPSFFSEHHENLRANVGDRLWFAGEATSQKYFGALCSLNGLRGGLTRCVVGFLHGAYFEGLDVATLLAKCIQGGGCTGIKHIEEIKNLRPYKV